MNDIIDFCDRTAGEFDKYVIFFMTDGIAPYPYTEVNNLLNKPYINKIQFNAVAYGDGDSRIVQQMGSAFPNGTFKQTSDQIKLIELFVNQSPK